MRIARPTSRGPHARGEPVVDAVRPRERLVLVGRSAARSRPGRTPRAGRSRRPARRRRRPTARRRSPARRGACRRSTTSAPAATARSTMPGDALALVGRDDRARARSVSSRGSPTTRLCAASDEAGDEVVVDRRRRRARGTAAVQSWPALHVAGDLRSPATTRLEVGVVEHDDRRLAAELEVHALQRVGRGLGDDLAGGDVAGERHQRDAGMARRAGAPASRPGRRRR